MKTSATIRITPISLKGIQEEILTRLAKIADLKVISRTSTQRYHSKPGNLAEIAKQLGVANIVEGSVQKTADQVRVNVQLINAQTDSHLWAETYDRKLTDLFGVESEIAKRIAESLKAKLTGREKQALAVKPTNNPEAYDAYLRGLAFEARSAPFLIRGKPLVLMNGRCSLTQILRSLGHGFAARTGFLYIARNETHRSLAATADEAKRALDNAQKLAPDSSETLLALGYYQYWVLRDYTAAKITFESRRQTVPWRQRGAICARPVTRREGHWAESISYFDQALALDPRNVELLNDTAVTYVALKQLPAALKLYDRVLDIKPNDPDMMATKASIYQAEGNLQEAARSLSEINGRLLPAAFRNQDLSTKTRT